MFLKRDEVFENKCNLTAKTILKNKITIVKSFTLTSLKKFYNVIYKMKFKLLKNQNLCKT